MIKLCINICFTKVSVCVATMVGQCPNTCLYLDVTNITYIRKYTYFVGIVYKYSVCLLCRPLPTICCKCSGDSTLLLILIHSSYAMNSQLYFLLFRLYANPLTIYSPRYFPICTMEKYLLLAPAFMS